jgi:hypothetical protein
MIDRLFTNVTYCPPYAKLAQARPNIAYYKGGHSVHWTFLADDDNDHNRFWCPDVTTSYS